MQCSKPIKVEFNGNFVDIPKDLHWPPNEMRRNQTPTFAGFTLIDEKGNRFEFGYTSSAIEYSKKFFKQGRDIWLANAWHLTGIVLANGQNVRLNYERGAYIDQLYSSYMRVLDQEGKTPKWSSCNSSFDFFTKADHKAEYFCRQFYLKLLMEKMRTWYLTVPCLTTCGFSRLNTMITLLP